MPNEEDDVPLFFTNAVCAGHADSLNVLMISAYKKLGKTSLLRMMLCLGCTNGQKRWGSLMQFQPSHTWREDTYATCGGGDLGIYSEASVWFCQCAFQTSRRPEPIKNHINVTCDFWRHERDKLNMIRAENLPNKTRTWTQVKACKGMTVMLSQEVGTKQHSTKSLNPLLFLQTDEHVSMYSKASHKSSRPKMIEMKKAPWGHI